jgi:hypothetical protein
MQRVLEQQARKSKRNGGAGLHGAAARVRAAPAAGEKRGSPPAARTSPSGNRTERPNLRVETLMSIWFMAHLPSQFSATAASQLGTGLLSVEAAKPGPLNVDLPPWKPILPFVLPQRCARRSRPPAWRGPLCILASASIPAARPTNSKLATCSAVPRLCLKLQRSRRNRSGCANLIHGVAVLCGISTPKTIDSMKVVIIHRVIRLFRPSFQAPIYAWGAFTDGLTDGGMATGD